MRTRYFFIHKIKGEDITLVSDKEGEDLAIFYADNADMNLGDPWQFISDLDKARLYGVHEGIAACRARVKEVEAFTEVGLDKEFVEIEAEDEPADIDE